MSKANYDLSTPLDITEAGGRSCSSSSLLSLNKIILFSARSVEGFSVPILDQNSHVARDNKERAGNDQGEREHST